LFSKKGSGLRSLSNVKPISGKSALVINGGTPFGKAVSSFLLSKGARVAVHTDNSKGTVKAPSSIKKNLRNQKFFSTKENDGLMTPSLFKQIIRDFGSFDFIIQDLGTNSTEASNCIGTLSSQTLEANLRTAHELSSYIEAENKRKGSGRILYVSPSAWHKHIDFLRYEAVKAGTIAITRALAKQLAGAGINVNCVIPGYIDEMKPANIEREILPHVIKHIPMGHVGELEDIVEVISFLISDASKYLTGQVMEVAGGINQR
jgi:3-oxoacyl-[acyl-carrier protein] reductase